MGCAMFYGRVCVIGGNLKCDVSPSLDSNYECEPTSLCQEFSFSERKWKPLKELNIARFGHCVCSFDEKPTKLFVYGGERVNGDWTNSAEIYDPQKRGWFLIDNGSKYNRYGSSCCIWSNNIGIIIVGGQDEYDQNTSNHVEIYHYDRNTWTVLNDLNY